MTATAVVTKTVILLWLCCYCCYSSQVSQESTETSRHHHSRTKSSTNRKLRTEHLTEGMPVVSTKVVSETVVTGTAAAGEKSEATSASGEDENNVGMLRNYLIRKPTNIFKSLLRTSVDLVQEGMDKFQGVSTKFYSRIRKVTYRPTRTRSVRRDTLSTGSKRRRHRAGQSSGGASGDGASSGSTSTLSENGQSVNGTIGQRRKTGLMRKMGNKIVSTIDTGVAGMQQVTDLGLLLGNIGTHKIRASLDGKNGNQEVLKLLIRYVGTRVGMGTKLSASEFLDNVGNVSTFLATDDEATAAICTLMMRLMNDPEASASMVRLAVMVLESSPSTSCLLDQLPLAPADIRMAFDVFVGSKGEVMLTTIAGLVSHLTTGPDTRAFLESMMGMMSMFKSDSSSSEKSEKPKSMVSSLKNFFTNTDEVDDDDSNEKEIQQKQKLQPKLKPKLKPKRAKTENQVDVKGSKLKPSVKPLVHIDDPWFGDFGGNSFSSTSAGKENGKKTTKSIGDKVTKPIGDKDKPHHDNTGNIKHDTGGNKSNGKNKSPRRKKSSESKSTNDDSGSMSSGSLSASDGDKIESSQSSKKQNEITQ